MRDGLREAVEEAVRGRGAPFLGICVGMQMLMAIGLEHGARPGLGWIEGVCAPLETEERLPHMGWNAVTPLRAHPMLDGLAPARHMVFMHSYVVVPEAEADVAAVTEHGLRFVSAIARANMVGVQFHPEKSQAAGLDLLGRFLRWRP
jgi:glutamine amidotransferase